MVNLLACLRWVPQIKLTGRQAQLARYKKDCDDDGGKHTRTRGSKAQTWSSGRGGSFDLRRERYSFERSPSDKPFSCTGVA